MPVTISPTEAEIQAALRSFCLSVLPVGTDVIEALDNRVPEPQTSNFVVMTPMRRVRLATNLQVEADCSFTASIAGQTMTVTDIGPNNQAAIAVGASVVGPRVPLAVIDAQTSGTTGGIGTYTVSPSYMADPGIFAAGQLSVIEMVETAIQLGFHSANSTGSDMAQAIHQMLRDPYAVRFIQAINPAIAPLYGSDARQVPFIDAEDQFEWRWVIEAVLQANVTLTGLSQDFVTTLNLALVNVDVIFRPSGIFTLDDSLLDGPDVLG